MVDLNSPLDFARATSGIGGILQQFTGQGEGAWVINEGSYTGGSDKGSTVLFHVFASATNYQAALAQIADTGGRRKVKFKFPYNDGQTTDDLGRTPQTFNLDIILHGDNYLEAFKNLFTELNDPVPGTLVHPVLGRLTCGMESYEVTHSNDKRKAVSIRLTMIEHNFSVADIQIKVNPTVQSALSKLLDAFKKIDNAVTAVEATLLAARSLKNQLKNLINDYKSIFARNASSLNTTFNAAGAGQFPSLLPTTEGGVQQSNGTVSTDIALTSASPNDPFQNVPVSSLTNQTSQALAAEQIAKDIQAGRDQLTNIIRQMSDLGSGQGSLEFFDEILGLRETANDMQDAFEKGKQSSQFKIISYMTPRLMSVREVAFDIGIPLNRVDEISILNPQLESANYIPKGTKLRVAK
jgi:hypothetical protein